jgi:hypothetical protein
MGPDIRDTLKAYWTTAEQFSAPFFGKTMKRGRFSHILRYLHFADNRDEPDKRDDNFDRLWKMRTISDMLNESYAEHSAVYEITVLFKGRVVFRHGGIFRKRQDIRN